MGTPEFAVHSLDALIKANKNIVAVVTAPDKPAGRGLTLQEPDVKKYARSLDIPVLQPEKLKDPVFNETLKALNPDLVVVVAFRMLPEQVWQLPRYGTINLHASLLPQYRGAAPINWAIINGDTQTGATTFFIEKEIDTGLVISSVKVPISETDTAGTLHDKLAVEGAKLLVESVTAIENNQIKPVAQNGMLQGEELRPAPKIFRDVCRINWHNDTRTVYNFIRGLSPYPGAWTQLVTGNVTKTLKILECQPDPQNIGAGRIFSDDRTFVKIGTQNGALNVLKLQLEGKKAMLAEEFLRGFRDIKASQIN